MRDAAFASGAPFDEFDEPVGVFDGGTGWDGFPVRGITTVLDAGGGEVGFDGGSPSSRDRRSRRARQRTGR